MRTIIILCLFVAVTASARSVIDNPSVIVNKWVETQFAPGCKIGSYISDEIVASESYERKTLGVTIIRRDLREYCNAEVVEPLCLSKANEFFTKRYGKKFAEFDCVAKEEAAAALETANRPKKIRALGEECMTEGEFMGYVNGKPNPYAIRMKYDAEARNELVEKSQISTSDISKFKIHDKVCYADVTCENDFKQRGQSFVAGSYRVYCSPMCDKMDKCTDSVNNCGMDYFEDICEHSWVQFLEPAWKILAKDPAPVQVGAPIRDTAGQLLSPTTTNPPKKGTR